MKLSPLDRARRYLAKCPAAISGQGGHNATFHAAAVLVHGFALDPADALTLLREWNYACQPPWSEAELRHKVGSAAQAQYAYGRKVVRAGHVPHDQRFEAFFGDVGGGHKDSPNEFAGIMQQRQENEGTLLPR